MTISVDWGDLPPPDGAHLSPVVASAHAPGAPFWSAGALASPGLASLVTAGDPSGVEDEHTSDCAVVIAEGLSTPSGSTRFTLDVSESCSSVDLATMVGPSPDWFIGVSDLSLRDDGGWLSNVTVPASLWDAGQLEGDSFSAPTGATIPAAPVSDRALSLGTITFERTSNRHVELENLPPASTEITEVLASTYPGNALREVITFKTLEAAEGVVVFWADGDTEARVSEIGPAGTAHRITLVGLRAETTWHFVPAAWSAGKLIAGPNGTFETGALPDEVPVFELQAKLVSVWDSFYQNVEHRGLTLVDFYDAFNPGGADEAFVILDDEARVVWYEYIPIVIKSQPLNV